MIAANIFGYRRGARRPLMPSAVQYVSCMEYWIFLVVPLLGSSGSLSSGALTMVNWVMPA